jgi:anti-sigma B factor antagonist
MEPLALTTHLETADGSALLRVGGDVDLASSDALRQALATAFETATNVTVDVADVSFIDSSGLSALVWGHEQAKTVGGSFQIRRPSALLRRLLQITRLETVLAVADVDDQLPGTPGR